MYIKFIKENYQPQYNEWLRKEKLEHSDESPKLFIFNNHSLEFIDWIIEEYKEMKVQSESHYDDYLDVKREVDESSEAVSDLEDKLNDALEVQIGEENQSIYDDLKLAEVKRLFNKFSLEDLIKFK